MTEASIVGNERKQLEQLLPWYAGVFSKNNEEFGLSAILLYVIPSNALWKHGFLLAALHSRCWVEMETRWKMASYGAVGTLCCPGSSGFHFLLLIHLLPLKKLTSGGTAA